MRCPKFAQTKKEISVSGQMAGGRSASRSEPILPPANPNEYPGTRTPRTRPSGFYTSCPSSGIPRQRPFSRSSYVAVQLIEKQGTLDLSSLKDMAEQVQGSFTFADHFTSLTEKQIARYSTLFAIPELALSINGGLVIIPIERRDD